MINLDISHWKIFALTLLSGILLRKLVSTILHWRSLPPGPWGLPIVGYLPFLSFRVHETIVQLTAKYGKILSMKIGPQQVIFISDYDLVEEACANDHLQGRPPLMMFNMFTRGKSTFFESSDKWLAQRRLVLHQLRNLGFARGEQQEQITEEIGSLLAAIHRNGDSNNNRKSREVPFSSIMRNSARNNISRLVFGRRMVDNDGKVIAYHKLVGAMDQADFNSPDIITASVFPGLYYILEKVFGLYRNFKQGTIGQIRETLKVIKQQREQLDESCEPGNFVDGTLIDLQRPTSQAIGYDEHTLAGNVLGLFGAGVDTTSISLDWAMVAMAAYPEIQSKVQNEIERVCGDKQTEWVDSKLMPYTMAVIYELQRWRIQLPLNLPRLTTQDTTLAGYKIAKGTILYFNFWSIHSDPANWPEPEKLDPMRFLTGSDADGDLTFTKPAKGFAAWSLGRRSCPGEHLAKQAIFLYLTSILQRFTVKTADGKPPSLEPQFHFLQYTTQAQSLCFTARS